jgi:two-component system OmpR family sensor kinase
VKRAVRFSRLIVMLYVGTVVPLLLIVGLVLYGEYRDTLVDSAASRLSSSVKSVAERRGPPGPPSLANELPLLARAVGRELPLAGIRTAVLDGAGTLAPETAGAGLSEPLSVEAHRAARDSGEPVVSRIASGAHDRLLFVLPMRDGQNRVVATVEGSVSLESLDAELAALRGWMIVLFGAAMVVALVAAPIVARVGMAPLKGLVDAAHSVAAGDLECRAPLSGVVETRELAAALNGMLDRIRDALDERDRTNAEMHRFAADASHELRSPLAVIRSGVEVSSAALRRGDTEQAAQVMTLLESEVVTTSRLVEDLLLLLRVDRPVAEVGETLVKEPVEPAPLLEEVYERARLVADGQRLELEWPTESLDPVLADRDMLRRALNNLVENALSHTPDGGAVRLGVSRAAEGRVRFTIEDEGCGIPPEQLPHVFDRFYRGDAARARQTPGTGLGLPIARAIALAHGGSLEIESRASAGTRALLEMPEAVPDDVQPTFSQATGFPQTDPVA